MDFNGVDLELNGKIFTYDPNDENNKDFIYHWICMDDKNVSCVYLLDSDINGIVYVNLSRYSFDYSSSYSFTFTMTVQENGNIDRNKCVTIY